MKEKRIELFACLEATREEKSTKDKKREESSNGMRREENRCQKKKRQENSRGKRRE